MSRRYITADEQRQIIQRAQRRCEYCQSLMDYSPQAFDIEHIIPVAQGGQTHLENLALACGGCNSHKYTKTNTVAPISQKRVDPFHPRQDPWTNHFV